MADLKGEIDKPKIILEDINIALSICDRTSR